MKIAAGLALGVVIACSSPPRLPPEWKIHQQKSNEITALWTQIRQWRSEIPNMPLDPPGNMLQIVKDQSVDNAKKACPENHTVPEACGDVCSIAENICDNAERICTLALELGKKDTFAQSKCTSAKASCREAKQRCCGCSDKAKESK